MKGDPDTRSKRQAATKSFQPLATLGHFVFVVRKAAGASRGPSRSRGWPRFARRAAPSLGVWWQLMILMRSGRRRRQLPAARRPCPLGPLGPLSLGGKTRQPRPLAPAGSTGPNSQTPGLGLPEPRSSTDRQEGRASTGVSSRPRCAPETLRVTSPQRQITQVQTDFPAAGDPSRNGVPSCKTEETCVSGSLRSGTGVRGHSRPLVPAMERQAWAARVTDHLSQGLLFTSGIFRLGFPDLG